MRIRAGLRSLATLLSAVAVATCSDAPNGIRSGPSPATQLGRIGVAPVFSQRAQTVARNTSAFGFTFDHVRLVVRGTPDTTVIVKDTTVEFTPTSPDLTLDLVVLIVIEGQKFDVALDYISTAAGSLFHGSAVATSYRPGRTPPPPQPITLEYVGPGATVARLAITPDTTTVIGTASASLTVAAFDDKNAPVAVPPLLWSTSDPNIVDVVGTGATVSAQGKNIRGKAAISVTSPSGAADTSDIVVGLPAASIVVVSGAGQAGTVHTPLESPAVVQVNAVDDIGVPGVTVVFAAPAGGAVSTTSVVTDANGRASTNLTLGTVAGPQAFVASTANFSVSIAATASASGAAATTIVAGANQVDTIGRTLAPLSVKIVDEFANPVPNTAVSWTRVRGTGTLGSATSNTNADGVATNTYKLGTTAGSDSVAVASGSATTGFVFTTKAGNAAAIAVVSGTEQTAAAGSALAPFVVKVTDSGGNPVANATVTWSAVNGTIAPSTTTDAQGQTSNPMTLGAAGAASATASIGADRQVVFTATATASGSAHLQLIPPSPTSFTKQAGTALSSRPSIQVVDASGAGIANAPVHIRTTQADTTVLELDLTAGPDGKLLAPDAADINLAGTYTVTATSTAAPGSSVSVTLIVTPGVANKLEFTSPNGITNQEAGAVITPAVAVSVRDFYGNLVSTAANQITVALSDPPTGATLSGTKTVAAVNGVATFSDLSINLVHDLYRLSATSGTLESATSLPINIVAPGTMHLGFTGVPDGTAGTAIGFAVEALDVHDQLLATATPTVTLSVASGPGTFAGTARVTAVAGKATFSDIVFTKAGTYTLRATAVDAGTAMSNTFTIVAAGAAKISKVAGDNQSAPVNTAVPTPPKMLITDEHDNPVPNASVRLQIENGGGSYRLIGGDGNATSGPATADANGFLTLDAWTLGATATTNTLRASLEQDPSAAVTFTANATTGGGGTGGATQLQFVTQPSALTAGQSFSVEVELLDANGNATNATGTVSIALASAPSGATLNGSLTANASAGRATFSNLSLTKAGSGYSLIVTGTGLQSATSASFAVNAAAASAIAIVNGNNGTGVRSGPTTVAPSVRVTDAYENPVSGASVTFTITAGGGRIRLTSGGSAVTTGAVTSDATGLAALDAWILGAVAGTNNNTLDAALTSDAAVKKTFIASATPGPASAIGKALPTHGVADNGDNQTAVAGTTLPKPFIVRVTDGTNPVAGAVVTWVATNGTAPTTSISDANGLSQITMTVGATTGTQAAAAQASIGGNSVTFHATVTTPPATDKITAVSSTDLSGVAGQPVSAPPKVHVTDGSNAPLSGNLVAFSVQSGGGTITPANGFVVTDANGDAALTEWTLGATPGTNTVTATLVNGASVTFTAHSSGAPATIAVVSGTPQTAAVGTALTAFVVKVVDASNNPVSGQTVNWALTNASVASATTTTGSDGTSSYVMTLGHTPGAASAVATVSGVTGNATFSATATVGAASKLVFSAQPSSAISAAAISPAVKVEIQDQFGNLTAATDQVTIAIGANPSTGTLAGTKTVAAVSGVATFSDLSIDKAGTGYTLSATSGSLTAATSAAFNISAGAAAHLDVNAGDNVTAVINSTTSPAPSVRVTDAAGNPVSGATVTFTADGGRGSTTPANGQVQSGANGIATLGAWTMSGTAGAHTLTATLNSLTVTFHATASTAAPSTIVKISGDSQTDTAGTVAADPLIVRVGDGTNNVAGAVVTWTVTNGKINGSTSTVTTITDATGQASVDLTLGETAGTGVTSAVATIGNGANVMFTASAVAGAPAKLAITTQPASSVTAGSTLPSITVGLRDQFGNAATGTNAVTLDFGTNPGGGLLGGTRTQNAVAGTATFSDLSILKAGVGYTLVASASGLTSATTSAFTVVAGAPANMDIVQGNNASGVAGAASSPAPQVRVTDANGNNVSGASVTFSVLTGGGSVSPTPVTTDASGLASTTWTLGSAVGSNTLEAHVTTNAAIAVNFTSTGASGTAAHIEISTGNGQSATVQQTFANPFIVKVTDANSNVISGAIVTWTVAGGTLSSLSTTTDAAGLASTTMTTGTVAGAVSATATVPGGGSVTFTGTAVPGGATQLTYTTGPTTTVAGATMSPVVVAVRDAFNNLVTTSTAAVTVAIDNNPATGTLSGTTTRNAVNGVATFSDLSIDHSGTGYTLIASATSLQSATSSAFNINVGAPAHIDIVEGDNLTAVVDQATATPPTVKITDANGNLVPGANVTFTVKTGNGTIKLTSSGSAVTTGTVATDASGLAAVNSWILGPAIGANSLEARVSPSLAVTFNASGSNAAPSSIAKTGGDTQSDTVATTLVPPLEVIVRDANSNPVTGAAVTWTATNGSVTGTTTTRADGKTTNVLTLGTTAGAASVTAKITNGQQVVFTATVNPGNPKSLEFTTQPFHRTAHVVLDPPIKAMLRDQFGNATPSATNAVKIALGTNPTSASLEGTTTRNAVAGVVEFDDVAVSAAGAGFRLSVTATGVDSAVSNAFSVSSNVVSTVTAQSGGAQSGTANTDAASPLVVRVADASDADIVAAAITWSSRHGTVLSATETSTDSTGRTSITIKYSTVAGTDTITATSVNGKVAEFVVTSMPDVAVKLGFLVPNGTMNYNGAPAVPITDPVPLQVAVQDQYGNTVTTSTASIALTLSAPNGAEISNATSRAATAGVVIFDQASINKAGVYTVFATSPGFANVASLPISIPLGGGQH